jgi:phosphonate transport system permease protein
MKTSHPAPNLLPPRFPNFTWWHHGITVVFIVFFLYSLYCVEFWILFKNITDLPENTWRVISEMMPPNIHRLPALSWALLVTFQIAFVGLYLVSLLVFLSEFCFKKFISPFDRISIRSRNYIICPNSARPGMGRFIYNNCRFGSNSRNINYYGRYDRFLWTVFAEAMEEADDGPQEALMALGATKTGMIFSAIAPAALPSMINTSLFSLEKATRSSVILGVVGAGGIGIELFVAMQMFEYDLVATCILCIFLLVISVEQCSSYIRHRLM